MVRYTVGLSGDVANILDDKYEELCESANVYEVTSMDTPMKLFCDIDIYDEKELYHDAIAGVDIITEMAIDKVKELLALFGIDAKWCICDSSSPSFTCWKTKKQKWN